MKWWSRLTRQTTPKRPATRAFNAAKNNHLTHSWVKQPVSLDQELWGSLNTLRARSREQAQNNPYVQKFLNLCKANIIGPRGMQHQHRAQSSSGELDKPLNEAIEQAFKAWGEHCEVTGRMTWLDVQRLLIETIARDGEVLIRTIQGFDNPSGFAIQIIDVDYLDTDLNGILPNGHSVRLGVEVDEWQRAVAYHLKRPQAWSQYANIGPESERVPANELIHVFNFMRPHQVRGIPWLHAVLLQLQMLGGYAEAELVAARLAASKMGFFERNAAGEGYSGDGISEEEEGIVSCVEPGTFEQLPNGVSFKPWDPSHPAGNFDPFIKACLRGIASGLGVSYNSLANDLSSVNYSSIRSGLLEEREHWLLLQTWFAQQCCTPIFKAWLKSALLNRKLTYSISDYNRIADPTWQGRRWPWVDPLKDLKAIELELQLGLTSLDEVIRRLGRDPEQVFQNLVKTRDELKALGLTEILNRIYGTPEENANHDSSKATNE